MRLNAARVILLLLAAALLLPACAARPAVAEPAALTWNGNALVGETYYQRIFDDVTVHYAEPTRADVVERVGAEVQVLLDQYAMWGRLPGERLAIWIVPRGRAWPAGLDPNFRPMRAVAPLTIVMAGEVLPENEKELLLGVLGAREAIAVAMSQPAGSLAYSVDWLYAGYGRVMSIPLRDFPTGAYATRYQYGDEIIVRRTPPWSVADILAVLDSPDGRADKVRPWEAAGAVLGLVIDRWGLNWWEYYPGDPAAMTPREALRWATDGPLDVTAADLSMERMAEMIEWHATASDEVKASQPVTLADQGRNRIATILPRAPVPGNNRSAQAYRLDVGWDPGTRTISGTERFTWRNGEGVPVARLYFNVWGNSTRALWHGGFTAVEAAAVDGKAATYRACGLDLVLVLGRQVQPGEQVQVTIRFRTRLPAPKKEPDSPARFDLALWYPALARLDDAGWHLDSFPDDGEPIAEPADYAVSLSVPAGTHVEAPGPAPGVTELGPQTVYEFSGTNLTHWSATLVTER